MAPFLDCDDFHTAASLENREIQQMGNVRAISVASFRSSSEVNGVKGFNIVEGNTISNLRSPEFPDYKTIGIDVQGVSDGMVIQENVIDVVPGAGPYNDPHVLGIRVSVKWNGCRVLLVQFILRQELTCIYIFCSTRYVPMLLWVASRCETNILWMKISWWST